MNASPNILLIESDEQSAQDIQRFLKVSAFAFTISHATDNNEALNYLRNRKPDIVLLDTSLTAKKDFDAVLNSIQLNNVPFILLSDLNLDETRNRAKTSGATDYMLKNKINLFHLQKAIVSALKLSEAESKLDETVQHFVTQNESLQAVLNQMRAGVLVIDSKNEVRFTNSNAYHILSDENIRPRLNDYLRYTNSENENNIALTGNGLQFTLRVVPSKWNGEIANIFIIEKREQKKEPKFFETETFTALMNSIDENTLLLQNNTVVFANKNALHCMARKSAEVNGKKFQDFFETENAATQKLQVQHFFADKNFSGKIKQAGGSQQPVNFILKPLHAGGEFFQVVSFHFKTEGAGEAVPSEHIPAEKFSSANVLHIASHDLREPVRTILNYVQLVADNLKQKKYDAAAEYTEFAKVSADRMEKLLSDLKIYIGLNDYHFSLSKFSMKLVVSEVLKQLKPRIAETGAEITVAELPDVSADRELVEKLLWHLLDNALKFSKKGRKPVIDIGYDKFEGSMIFCVRDNGIGISKKYYPRIFEIFERLNRVDQYPGNGLGLAICKKIIEMHGGEIWVESLPGSGCNFYFTLTGKVHNS